MMENLILVVYISCKFVVELMKIEYYTVLTCTKGFLTKLIYGDDKSLEPICEDSFNFLKIKNYQFTVKTICKITQDFTVQTLVKLQNECIFTDINVTI